MEKAKDYKIGDKIPFGRVTLEVVEYYGCAKCIFSNWDDCDNLKFVLGECGSTERYDDKSVNFKICEDANYE